MENIQNVDSVIKYAYKDDELKNGYAIREVPILKVGENIMMFSGNVSEVEVKINEVRIHKWYIFI